MKKMHFTATYCGSCYIKAYGRKFYKQGVLLQNIALNDKLIVDKMTVSKGKAFDLVNENYIGNTISFDAVLNSNNELKYISNVQIVV